MYYCTFPCEPSHLYNGSNHPINMQQQFIYSSHHPSHAPPYIIIKQVYSYNPRNGSQNNHCGMSRTPVFHILEYYTQNSLTAWKVFSASTPDLSHRYSAYRETRRKCIKVSQKILINITKELLYRESRIQKSQRTQNHYHVRITWDHNPSRCIGEMIAMYSIMYASDDFVSGYSSLQKSKTEKENRPGYVWHNRICI